MWSAVSSLASTSAMAGVKIFRSLCSQGNAAKRRVAGNASEDASCQPLSFFECRSPAERMGKLCGERPGVTVSPWTGPLLLSVLRQRQRGGKKERGALPHLPVASHCQHRHRPRPDQLCAPPP